MPIAGEVIFLRVFDLGGTLNLPRTREILGPMAEIGAVQSLRAAPEYVSFAAPIPLNLAGMKLEISSEDGGAVTLSARLYEVGSLAVMLRYAVRAEQINDLARFQSLRIKLKGETVRRSQIFSMVFEAIKPVVKAAFDDVVELPIEAESYTAYCLTEVPGGSEYVFAHERSQIAGLLISEPNPGRLALTEVEDILKNWHSYYRDDLVVADWDAALVIDPSGQYEDILYLFEVANLQLLAMRKYDLFLDRTLDRGYEDYERLSKALPLSTGSARQMVRELSAVRMDMAKITDEIANTAKFFGDWHIARVYMGLAGKLHIGDYHRSVEEKLATLNDLYQSVLSEIDRRQNLVLEVMIVVLIVFEVGMALWRH